MNRTLTHLLTRAAAEATDGRLLDAFVSGRDPAAFEGLVRRHGPMVLAVGLRVLRHRQDAEDAFQATFLVLARRAADVWPRDAVGSWLHGVAYRVALKARARRARLLARQQPLVGVEPPAAEPSCPDLVEAIDRVVGRLPGVYRAAVVACDLEGLSRQAAAERLGWKEGTLSGRLARARQLLADRLRRAGLALPAGGVAAVAGVVEANAVPSAELIANAIRLADLAFAAGVAAPVAALTEGVMHGMLLTKVKIAAVTVLAAGAIGLGVWSSAGAGDGPGPGLGQKPGGEKPAAKGKAQPDADAARAEVEQARATVLLAEAQLEAARAKLRHAEGKAKGVDLTAAADWRDKAHLTLEDALATIKRRVPATDPDDFLRQLHQDRERVNAALQLMDQAEREFQAAKVKSRPAPQPDTANLSRAALARAEVERQRAAVLTPEAERVRDAVARERQALDAQARAEARIDALEEELAVAKRRAADLEARVKDLTNQAEAQRDAAVAAERRAREAVEEFRREADRLRELQKKDDGTAKAESLVPAVSVRTADGNTVHIHPGHANAKRVEELVMAAFLNCGGELAPTGKGVPFATADRWKRAEAAAHVRVSYRVQQVVPQVGGSRDVAVTDILIPVSATHSPDYVLIRHRTGTTDTYRAFHDLPEDKVKELQKLIADFGK
jgi:RNA polymerase sigma factor (sigma-70 family)